MKAVEGTAGQPGGEVRLGEGDGGAGGSLGKAAVGQKRDMQERVMHRGPAVPALVLIRQVPAGVTPKRQMQMTEFHQQNTSVKTARDETKKKVTTKKVKKTESKEENRNNTKKVVGEEGERKRRYGCAGM